MMIEMKVKACLYVSSFALCTALARLLVAYTWSSTCSVTDIIRVDQRRVNKVEVLRIEKVHWGVRREQHEYGDTNVASGRDSGRSGSIEEEVVAAA